MVIENYKGFDISHDAEKDEFVTSIQTNLSGEKKAFLKAARLQKVRDEIEKFLTVATKKPVLKKAWIRNSSNYDDKFFLVTIIIYNKIGKSVMVEHKDGKIESIKIGNERFWGNKNMYPSCKENDAIVNSINKKIDDITKIKKEFSCSSGKLIPLDIEHFS